MAECFGRLEKGPGAVVASRQAVAVDTPYTRTLARAARAVGGEAALAKVLKVTEAQLRAWLEGRGTPPMQVFSSALDIVAKGRA